MSIDEHSKPFTGVDVVGTTEPRAMNTFISVLFIVILLVNHNQISDPSNLITNAAVNADSCTVAKQMTAPQISSHIDASPGRVVI